MSRLRLRVPLASLVLAVLVSACAATPPPQEPAPPAAPPVETELERRPIPPSGVHEVAAGESLSEIAYVYRLDTDALARANGIADPDRIAEGRQLVLRWPEPPARPATARAEAADPDGAADADAAGSPLRVVVTPRDEVEAEAAPAAPSAGGETTPVEAAPTARWGLDTAAVAPPPAARDRPGGARGAAPEE